MRRIGIIVALGALLGMLGGVATASPALAGGRGDGWQILPAGHLDFDDTFCAFPVGVDFPVNREYFKVFETSTGSITLVTGSVTGTFTNLATGKTITVNLSGPYRVTDSGGSVTVAFRGLTGIIVERARAELLGVPAMSVIAGATAVSVDSAGNFTSVSPKGPVLVDICAALS
jgi:hypothetical protein